MALLMCRRDCFAASDMAGFGASNEAGETLVDLGRDQSEHLRPDDRRRRRGPRPAGEAEFGRPDLGHGLLEGVQVSPAQPADGVVDAAQLDEVRIPRDPGRIFSPEISGLSFPRSPDFGTEKHA